MYYNNNMNYNVSMKGSGVSLIAGSCIGIGVNLIMLYHKMFIMGQIVDNEYIKKASSISFVGGGMTSFGLYFLVPNAIRNLWI
jgi:hypothetical protein